MTTLNLRLSKDVSFHLEEWANKQSPKWTKTFTIHRALQLYLYSSSYIKEYDKQGHLTCNYQLPEPITQVTTRLNYDIRQFDLANLKTEALHRRMSVNTLINKILLLVATDMMQLQIITEK